MRKFILKESITLEEKRLNPSDIKKIITVMQDKDYSNEQISDTIKSIENDAEGYTAQHWLSQINQTQQDSSTNSEGIQQQNDEKAQEEEGDEEILNNEEQEETGETSTKSSDNKDLNTTGIDHKVEEHINTLREINSDAVDAFLNAIKGQIKNINYPFTKLLAEKNAFMDALLGNAVQTAESLNEASPFSGLLKVTRDIKAKNKEKKAKQQQEKDPVIKFIKIYNAFTKLNNKVASDYIDKNDAVIYRADIMSEINNSDPIDNIINIDAAACLNEDPNLKSKLEDAIKNHSVSQMSTYKFSDDDNDDLKRLQAAFNQLSDKDKKTFIAELQKELKDNK